jgi:hypothetical protein
MNTWRNSDLFREEAKRREERREKKREERREGNTTFAKDFGYVDKR